MVDLLPCAHCGEQPRLVDEERRINADSWLLMFQVACACSAQTGVSRSEEIAVEMWNRRAPAPPSALAALQARYHDLMTDRTRVLTYFSISRDEPRGDEPLRQIVEREFTNATFRLQCQRDDLRDALAGLRDYAREQAEQARRCQDEASRAGAGHGRFLHYGEQRAYMDMAQRIEAYLAPADAPGRAGEEDEHGE